MHIPFCVRKCYYCDFLSAYAPLSVQKEYVNRLQEEISLFTNADEYELVSVFFGGGTPSLLSGEEIESLLDALKERFAFSARVPAEITVECNPGTLTEEKLRIYHRCGVNRLSLGLQSADDRELKLLGRIHTWEEFLSNFALARKIGFANINIDLMSGLPGQSVLSWRETLRKVLALHPEHVSAYSLIIEPGTLFADWYGQKDTSVETRLPVPYVSKEEKEMPHPPLPNEDSERQMYYDTERILSRAGFHRYEISNYALPGFESVHNTGYWLRREYAGFGLGASSQIGRLRYKNTEDLSEYLSGDFSKREVQVLKKDDEIEETLILGLRMMKGVDLRKFEESFGVSAEDLYRGEVEKLTGQGLLVKEDGFLKLTPFGIDVSNQVFEEFLLD